MQGVLKKTAAGNYTAESVKNYVNELKSLYDNDFSEMRARMIALRDENRHLKEELEEFKAKEKYISATVLKAEQLAQHIKDEAEFQTRKRINEAENIERHAKHEVKQSLEALYEIQRSVALLLNRVIDTAVALKDTQTVRELSEKNAADIYRLVSGAARQKEDPQHLVG